MKCARALITVATALAMGVVADDDPAYYCDSDSYCEKKFPGTACISVDNYGDVISKCTPNTAKRPACRGAQPGLCPSYQSADIGYLNAHCVFVSEENLSLSSSNSGDESRRLIIAATNASSSASVASNSSSTSAKSSATSAAPSATADDGSNDSAATTAGDGADATFTVTIKGEKVTGQFVCLDVSDCANKAADPSTCEPTTCQAPTSKEVCTYHGTCTYKSRSKIDKRTCMCYAGFEGDKCEKEVSNACDVDCGAGGDCVDGECVCKKGFDGKEVDGKKGKPNQRCTRCTNDLACQNDNTFDTESGKCICGPGYTGDTCGATEDSCTKRTDCGIGSCKVLANGSSACFCPQCSPTCSLCDMNVDATFDCSTCATAAANLALINAELRSTWYHCIRFRVWTGEERQHVAKPVRINELVIEDYYSKIRTVDDETEESQGAVLMEPEPTADATATGDRGLFRLHLRKVPCCIKKKQPDGSRIIRRELSMEKEKSRRVDVI